jgi:hypothetical protein
MSGAEEKEEEKKEQEEEEDVRDYSSFSFFFDHCMIIPSLCRCQNGSPFITVLLDLI